MESRLALQSPLPFLTRSPWRFAIGFVGLVAFLYLLVAQYSTITPRIMLFCAFLIFEFFVWQATLMGLLAVAVWLLAGVAGFALLIGFAKVFGWAYGLLPGSIFGLSPGVALVILAFLLMVIFSDKRFFVLKRLGAMLIVGYLIATLVFVLVHSSPYDPVRLNLGAHAANHKMYLAMRHSMGLDKPAFRQYTDFVGGLVHGDLGYSVGGDTLGTPVSTLISTGLPQSLKLGGYALLLALYIGLPIGLISALKQNSLVDHGSQAVAITFFAVPAFVLAPLAQIIFGVELHWLPVQGWGSPGIDGVKEMILPVTLFAAGLAGFLAKSYRSFLLEILNQDYIRTARAKGLKERTVIYLHACKNTLLPLASVVGPLIAFLVVGAFIIEAFFGIPGIGLDTISAVISNDGPMIEGTTLLLALAVVFINMLTDIFYGMVDPRVTV